MRGAVLCGIVIFPEKTEVGKKRVAEIATGFLDRVPYADVVRRIEMREVNVFAQFFWIGQLIEREPSEFAGLRKALSGFIRSPGGA